jgi:predicted O-methyltransferase YrrM
VSKAADATRPDNRTAPCRTLAGGARQPLSLEELARPFVSDVPDVDEHAAALREYVVGQQARLGDIERQYAEAEAAVVDLRRQLSEQEGRAADLEREYTEAEAELVERRRQLSKQEARAADLEREYTEAEAELVERRRQLSKQEGRAGHVERRPGARLRLALVLLKLALKRFLAFLQTGRTFGRQLEHQKVGMRKVREAVFDIEAVLRNLETERTAQASRIDGLAPLIAEHEMVLAMLKREIVQQRGRIEELMLEEFRRERIRDHHFDEQPLVRLARSYRRDPWWPELQSLLKISMLHSETLYLLRSLAARTKDAIIEVGPYIGGSTIALGRGLQVGGGGPLICVEMGGSYPTHAVPTNDIITDLKSNVEAYGLSPVVHIIEGFTTDADVDTAVNRILDGRRIGLLFLDADGNVERDFELYRGRLSRGSILVYDDYLTEQAPEKQTTIKAWVDQAVASGFVENLGLYRWGTWVGRYWG